MLDQQLFCQKKTGLNLSYTALTCRASASPGVKLSHFLAIFLSVSVLLPSCTPTTGTRIPLNPTNLSKIKSIGVMVKNEENFSVRLSREEMTAAGAVLFGLLGAGIEAAARHSADTHLEERFKPIVGGYDPEKLMNERLRHYLQLAGSFIAVVADAGDGAMLRGKGLDGVLEVTLKEWGLRRCPGPSPEKVQVGLNVHARMFLLEDSNTVWERDELYLDGDCQPWQDFRSHEGLLRNVLTRAIDNLSGKIVNDILFP